MVAWHTLFALSGQRFRAPSKSLTFWPKLSPPYELPVLVPRTVATLTASPAMRSGSSTGRSVEYQLKVVAGVPLTLAELAVDGSSPPVGLPTKLGVGDRINWSSS